MPTSLLRHRPRLDVKGLRGHADHPVPVILGTFGVEPEEDCGMCMFYFVN